MKLFEVFKRLNGRFRMAISIAVLLTLAILWVWKFEEPSASREDLEKSDRQRAIIAGKIAANQVIIIETQKAIAQKLGIDTTVLFKKYIPLNGIIRTK